MKTKLPGGKIIQVKTVHLLLAIAVTALILTLAINFTLKQQKSSQPAPMEEASTLDKASLTCPVDPAVCQDLASYKEGSLSGRLLSGTPLLAAFTGEAEGFKLSRPNPAGKTEEFTLLIINNKEKGLRAQYYLKGTPIQKKVVSEGEQIATSSGAILSFLDGKSFVFIVQKKDQAGDFLPLSPTNFK